MHILYSSYATQICLTSPLSGVFTLSNYQYLGLFSLGLGLSANIVFYIGMHKLCVSKLERMDNMLLITNESYDVTTV
jgi:hypothetical protein